MDTKPMAKCSVNDNFYRNKEISTPFVGSR